MNNNILVHRGKIEKIEGITFTGGEWRFENNDPQIHIDFDTPVSMLQLKLDIEQHDLAAAESVIYFRTIAEAHSEEKSIHIDFGTVAHKTIICQFETKINAIRFDPVDTVGTCRVNSLEIANLSDNSPWEAILGENNSDNKKAVVLTHEMSTTGAPILAFHIAKKLHDQHVDTIVLSPQPGDGFLEDRFASAGIPVCFLESAKNNTHCLININRDGCYKVLEGDLYKEALLMALRKNGYQTVIANTVVSGNYVRLFKNYGFKVVSLIHEMKTTIQYYGFMPFSEEIAYFSDYLVFPNRFVEADFKALFPKIRGKLLIQSQGVYLKNVLTEKSDFDLSSVGVLPDDLLVMSSGSCQLRKGVDLFVSAAILLYAKVKDKRLHFIWSGDFQDKELQCWLEAQAKKIDPEIRLDFIPFLRDPKQYSALLKRASVFWGMSREDPFPSAILEAMNAGVPVVGFRHSGGIEEMLSDGRGILAENFSAESVALETEKLISGKADVQAMTTLAKAYTESLSFEKYTRFLTDCLDLPEVTPPELDLYRYANDKGNYFQYQLAEKDLKTKSKELNEAIRRSRRSKATVNTDEIVLFDTALSSDNVGDAIIMDACLKACRETFGARPFLHIPTHVYDEKMEQIENYNKIVCGTNLIYTKTEVSRQWAFPKDLANFKNICLLGVGMHQLWLDEPMSNYTKKLLNFILRPDCIHSVRDEETKTRLAEIGITNVLNTGCPTMWKLTAEHCEKIPSTKAKNALATVTDYLPDPDRDAFMLRYLKENYDKVYLWIQGQLDFDYLRKIIDTKDFILIPPTLEALDNILQTVELDYVGTRLHAGIRSLQHGRRSLIVSIDNRARAIAADTGLTIAERADLPDILDLLVHGDRKAEIHLRLAEIAAWKAQFA